MTNTERHFPVNKAFSNSHAFTTTHSEGHTTHKISSQASSYYTIHPTLHTIRRALHHHGPSLPIPKDLPVLSHSQGVSSSKKEQIKKLQWHSAIPTRKKNPLVVRYQPNSPAPLLVLPIRFFFNSLLDSSSMSLTCLPLEYHFSTATRPGLTTSITRRYESRRVRKLLG